MIQLPRTVPKITAFESSPDEGQGHARDMRVRWAFEEVGQPYDVELRSFDALKQPQQAERLRRSFSNRSGCANVRNGSKADTRLTAALGGKLRLGISELAITTP